MIHDTIDSIVDTLKRVGKRLRKFQDGQENVQFNLGGSSGIDKHYYSDIGGGIATLKDTTHILTFCQTDDNEQEEGSPPPLVVVRAFGCQRDNNSSIRLLTCIDSMEHDESLSRTTRYYNAHLLLSTKLLKSCFGGCLFPYELVDWLAKSVCFMERLFTFSFDENDKSINNTWLLSNDGDHWSFNMIKDNLVNCSDFRFDMLHVYWHFNYDEFSRLLKQCISEK